MVTAIISLYNGTKFLESCLQDLINQTLYKQNLLEIVIVDSASTDNPENIILKYQKQYKNIHFIRTPERESLYKSWNRAIKYSAADFITNANVDDIHRNDALEILMKTLINNPQIDLVYHNHYLSTIFNKPFEYHAEQKIITYPKFDNRTIYLHYPFCHQNMWRKSVHDKIGFFDENYYIAGDLDFAFKFSIKGLKALLIKEILGVQISRDDQLVVNQKFNEEFTNIYNNYFKPEYIFELYSNLGYSVNSDDDKFNSFRDLFYRFLKYKLPGTESFVCNIYAAGKLLDTIYKYSKNEIFVKDYLENALNYGFVSNIENFIKFLDNLDISIKEIIKKYLYEKEI